jgi:hypothetical protein
VSVHELGRDEQLFIDLLQRVDRADARVRQRRCGAGFTSEPLPLNRVARQVRRQRLECHGPAKPCVGGKVDASHSAAAELANDGIASNRLPRFEHRVTAQKFAELRADRLR